MASSRYGINDYGAFTYGPLVASGISAEPMYVVQGDYGTAQIVWTTPTGNFSKVALVRSQHGLPKNITDGDLLYTSTSLTIANQYTDTGITQGQEYFYALFALVNDYTPAEWDVVGSAEFIAAEDHAGTLELANLLPRVFTNKDAQIGGPVSTDTDLYSYLDLFGYQIDVTRTYIQRLLKMTDPTQGPGATLVPYMNQVGLSYDPQIPMRQQRILASHVSSLYKTKGTMQTAADFVAYLTGYSTTAVAGKNLMLSQDDATALNSVGHWKAQSNCTLDRVDSPHYTPPVPTYYPGSPIGAFRITGSAAGSVSVNCEASTKKYLQTIPVVNDGSTKYSASAQVLSATVTSSFQINIRWYDNTGNLISGTSGSYINTSTSTWTTIFVDGGLPPANAVAALPVIQGNVGAAGEIHYFDAVQFEQAATHTAYEDARRVNITMKADRINQVDNPSFEGGLSSWSILGSASVVVDTSIAWAGNSSAKVTPSANGDGLSTSVNLTGGKKYAASAWVKKNQSSGSFTFKFGGSSVSIGAGTDWQRVSTTFTPSTTGSSVVAFTGTATSGYMNIDAVLVEESSTVNEYFDGSGPVKTNLLTDPSFETTESFTATNGTASLNSSSSYDGSQSVQVVASGASDVTLIASTGVPVATSTTYTFSIYTLATVNSRSLVASINWYDSGGTLLSSSAGTSTSVPAQTTPWTRLSVSGTSPATAASAKVEVQILAPVANDTFYLDAMLLTQGTALLPYFNTSAIYRTSDYVWEGTANNSRSHYYDDLNVRIQRAYDRTTDWVPIGIPFALQYAQPGT